MARTITLTEEQLEELIKERMAHRPITAQGLFNSVTFKGDELLGINERFPKVAERLRNRWARNSIPDPAKSIYSNKPKYNEVLNEENYSPLSMTQVHNSIRQLVLNVFGKSNNRDLTDNEFDMAQELYTELKDWYISSYGKRLEQLEN